MSNRELNPMGRPKWSVEHVNQAHTQPQPTLKPFRHALFAEMAFIMNDYTEQAHVYWWNELETWRQIHSEHVGVA